MPRHKLKENEGEEIARLTIQLPKSMLKEIHDVLEGADGTTLSQFIRGKIKERLRKEKEIPI